MESKVLFIFSFKGREPKEIAKINRELFGYKDYSHHGKYTYQRNGLLSKFHIERVAKGVLLTDEVNDKAVLYILHRMGTKKIRRYYITVKKIIG